MDLVIYLKSKLRALNLALLLFLYKKADKRATDEFKYSFAKSFVEIGWSIILFCGFSNFVLIENKPLANPVVFISILSVGFIVDYVFFFLFGKGRRISYIIENRDKFTRAQINVVGIIWWILVIYSIWYSRQFIDYMGNVPN